ncbi:MAG: hypothetical protein K0R57_5497 [Paenibacillaceae bacterium]|jgi:DNA-binding LacI/PurR family transcriptional regulator/DNA-binding CsgD family transcriptional regulator|nr:hypothetical protein [Paenibacillaceae bacterium]
MSVCIVVEPEYEQSIWCMSILDGLYQALRHKRMLYMEMPIEQIPVSGKEPSAVIVIGSSPGWLNNAVHVCQMRRQKPVVLSNQPHRSFQGEYSYVCLDMMQSMQYLAGYLRDRKRRSTALYGIHMHSLADRDRLESYRTWFGADDESVFWNHNSLEACFEQFAAHAHLFDSVICANDFAAISLVKRLEQLEIPSSDLLIISYSGASLTSMYRSKLLLVTMNFKDFGSAAVAVCNAMLKNPAISSMNVKVKWNMDLEPGDWGYALQPAGTDALTSASGEERIYDDPELMRMMQVEHLLSRADPTDRVILKELMRGRPYEEIAGTCYLSLHSIKYRTKKMMADCGASSKKELVARLKEYIEDEGLLG